MVDKIAEGMSMFLSGPASSFAGMGLKLASQAAKGIEDYVQHYWRTLHIGYAGKCTQDRVQTRKGQEV